MKAAQNHTKHAVKEGVNSVSVVVVVISKGKYNVPLFND